MEQEVSKLEDFIGVQPGHKQTQSEPTLQQTHPNRSIPAQRKAKLQDQIIVTYMITKVSSLYPAASG